MVNKGSFFQRLKERWTGSGSGVKVETRSSVDPRTGAGPGHGASRPGPAAPLRSAPAPVQRVEPERQAPDKSNGRELSTDFAAADARSTRKLSEREEAMLALGTHFQELTTLLRGSHARMDDQLGKLVGAATQLTALPALSQQQLEMLQRLSAHMERQHALGEQLASTMTTLPALLQNVEGALARAAATDERTAATVREFQTTMDRIHGSMAQMVAHSETQAKASQQLADRRDTALQELATGMQETQQTAVKELQRTTDASLKALRTTNEDQSNRLQKLVQQNAGWNRAVLIGIGLVVLGIGAMIVLQLLR
ncbi:MAG: hypothetical protein FJ265_18635 [Planctomycetes bacterium]|nr:hypothetical protein [Planctomycetota bacterium]